MASLATTIWKVLFGLIYGFIRLFWKCPPKSIKGEIALVTGAGHGMGQLLCIQLAKLGAIVVAVDINESSNAQTVEMLKQAGAAAYGYAVDLRNKEEIHRLAANVRDTVGEVTMLVNNAGVIFPTDILSLTEHMIRNTFEVNILAHFWLIQEFLPHMKATNHGHIVSMSSYAGFLGPAFMTGYSATKHAVIGLIAALRNELRRQGTTGIKLSCICPALVTTGFVKNPRVNALVPVLSPEEVVDAAIPAILRNQFLIPVPNATAAMIFRDLVPDSVNDAVDDYIYAEVDLIETSAKKLQ